MEQQIVPKKKRELKKKDPYAYTITDKAFGEFKVVNSDNAWWMERTKLEAFINAFKYGANVKQAMVAIGISERQYGYFLNKHPDFCMLREACGKIPDLKALQTMVGGLGNDLTTARWYLERKMPEEYGQKNNIGIAVQVNVGERMREIKDKYSK